MRGRGKRKRPAVPRSRSTSQGREPAAPPLRQATVREFFKVVSQVQETDEELELSAGEEETGEQPGRSDATAESGAQRSDLPGCSCEPTGANQADVTGGDSGQPSRAEPELSGANQADVTGGSRAQPGPSGANQADVTGDDSGHPSRAEPGPSGAQCLPRPRRHSWPRADTTGDIGQQPRGDQDADSQPRRSARNAAKVPRIPEPQPPDSDDEYPESDSGDEEPGAWEPTRDEMAQMDDGKTTDLYSIMFYIQ